jgi:hypothetical protein
MLHVKGWQVNPIVAKRVRDLPHELKETLVEHWRADDDQAFDGDHHFRGS